MAGFHVCIRRETPKFGTATQTKFPLDGAKSHIGPAGLGRASAPDARPGKTGLTAVGKRGLERLGRSRGVAGGKFTKPEPAGKTG